MDDRYRFLKSLWAALQMGDFDQTIAPERMLDELETIGHLAKLSGSQAGIAYTIELLRGVVEAMRAEFVRIKSEDLVEQGVLAGKIAPEEREWAAAMGAKDGIGVLAAFIKFRPVLPVSFQSGKGRTVEIDETQRAINSQMGVSEEQFIKYNYTPAWADRIDKVQTAMNAACGVSPAAFLKYQEELPRR